MQPDNEKIIEAVAELQSATRKTMTVLLEYGATANTLGALVQVIGILQECYAPPSHNCYRDMSSFPRGVMSSPAAGAFVIGRRRTDNELSPELEAIVSQAVEEYEKEQQAKDSENGNSTDN